MLITSLEYRVYSIPLRETFKIALREIREQQAQK